MVLKLSSAEQVDETGDVDVQDILFGRSTTSYATVLEKEQPHPGVNLSSSSATNEDNPLDQAISEIKDIEAVNSFIDETPSASSDSDSDHGDTTPQTTTTTIPQWQKSFSCMHPHNGNELQNNPNSKTIEILSMMRSYYERTMDQWRAISYRKVISILMKRTDHIVTEEQAKAYPPPSHQQGLMH